MDVLAGTTAMATAQSDRVLQLCHGCARMCCWLHRQAASRSALKHHHGMQAPANRACTISIILNLAAQDPTKGTSAMLQVPVVAAFVEDDGVEDSWQQAKQPPASAPPQQLMSDVPLAPAEQVGPPCHTRM